MKKIGFIIVIVLVLGGIYGMSFSRTPRRLPQFSERKVIGPGAYELPQWSFDSRYLAFLDTSGNGRLMVYDSTNDTSWAAVNGISDNKFIWSANDDILYLKYRPDLSGSPFPYVSDLHRVKVDGSNDEVVAANLNYAGNFVWFKDNANLAILLPDPNKSDHYRDVYKLGLVSGKREILLTAREAGLQDILYLTFSGDDKSLFVYGTTGDQVSFPEEIAVYDMEAHKIRDRIVPSKLILPEYLAYPRPGVIGPTFEWFSKHWLLTIIWSPAGDCYNYAIFFINISNPPNSFCVPSVRGVVADASVSPDLSKISYLAVEGPGQNYVMVGSISPEIMKRLDK